MSKRTKAKATPVSERKREANRKNAQRSTGPKTARGKDFSRLNSLKHGLLARALPLRNMPFCPKEEEKDLEKLLRDLSLELRPQGRIEEMLVERIGCIHFQLSRLYRFQTAVTAIAMYKEFGAPSVGLGDPLTTIRLREELPKNLTSVLERCKQECASDELFSAELMKEIRASILSLGATTSFSGYTMRSSR